MRCSSFRLLLVAVAAAFHTPPVGGSRQGVAAEVAPVDALPADTNQIKRLTPEQATALAGSKGKALSFDGLTTLDAATATALAESKAGELYLSSLTTLNADTAKALAEFKGQKLDLNGLTTLDATTTKALAELKGRYLSLDGLTTLDAGTATALAEFKGGYLALNRLTTLDAATAKALAEFKGVWLSLNGLATLDADTVKALAEFKVGRLELNVRKVLSGRTTLDVDMAKTLAAFDAWDGNLSFIVAIESPDSVEIAAALAKRKGPLRLPNLTKISPKTLTALIEKEDVEIPLIETLELIQEPDGSPMDDFIIPKGFQSRQKARQQGS
jgi:ubiquinone biosynthesis protein UbiJ